MAINAKKVQGGGNRVQQPLLEEGTYPARLVQVIGLGMQARKPYAGQEKDPCYQLWVTYELADEFTVDEDGNEQEDKPRWLSERMNLFNLDSEKATSTKRYLALDPKQDNEGDWGALVNTPAMITIGYYQDKQGNDREKIINVAKMRDKEAKNLDELKNPTLVFDADDEAPDLEVFNSLPDFLKDIIKENLNYNGSALQAALGGEAGAAEPDEDADDDEPDY